MNRDKIIIAIDGPAGSGKSSTAQRVAQALYYLYLDSGAMYRSVTLKVLQNDIDPENTNRIVEIARNAVIDLEYKNNHLQIFLDGENVTYAIRSPKVTAAISPIAANREIREILVRKQRRIGKNGGVVAEGRDIGTVVFPDAELKIYMQASIKARAQRRQKQFLEEGIQIDLDELIDDIRQRDQYDENREHSPLCTADDAIILDTSTMTLDEQVEWIVNKAKEHGA